MAGFFCGWYFKCQSDHRTLAVIPAAHRDGGTLSGSLQVITDEGVWTARFPGEAVRMGRQRLPITLGDSQFRREGLQLALHTPGLWVDGQLDFGPLTPLRSDIMGPFRYVPFLECRHSVLSLRHRVNGAVCINGDRWVFRDAVGYIEGDRGRSFPREYLWTQCSFGEGALMLSVASIPLGPARFTGIIGTVYWQGREYRLATYRGARVDTLRAGTVEVRQGDMVLTARLLDKRPQPLLAPSGGAMTRTIHESAACRAAYCFRRGSRTLFALETPRASFEYEYPD